MKPYNDTDGKKEQVRAMFDGIARRYDLLNHLLSLGVDRGWRRRVVRAVRAERPRSVLDMATGTADLAIMLAKSCPGARVVGVDLSERMLAVGRVKVERESLSERIELVQGDAEQLNRLWEGLSIRSVMTEGFAFDGSLETLFRNKGDIVRLWPRSVRCGDGGFRRA